MAQHYYEFTMFLRTDQVLDEDLQLAVTSAVAEVFDEAKVAARVTEIPKSEAPGFLQEED